MAFLANMAAGYVACNDVVRLHESIVSTGKTSRLYAVAFAATAVALAILSVTAIGIIGFFASINTFLLSFDLFTFGEAAARTKLADIALLINPLTFTGTNKLSSADLINISKKLTEDTLFLSFISKEIASKISVN